MCKVTLRDQGIGQPAAYGRTNVCTALLLAIDAWPPAGVEALAQVSACVAGSVV